MFKPKIFVVAEPICGYFSIEVHCRKIIKSQMFHIPFEELDEMIDGVREKMKEDNRDLSIQIDGGCGTSSSLLIPNKCLPELLDKLEKLSNILKGSHFII